MTAKSIFLTSIFWFRVLDNDIITLMVTPSPLSTFKSQTGFVQYLLILILLIGIGIAVYLIQFTQVFKPKASENTSAAIKFTDQPIKSTVILNFKYNDEILNGQELRHWEESETLKYHKGRLSRRNKHPKAISLRAQARTLLPHVRDIPRYSFHIIHRL